MSNTLHRQGLGQDVVPRMGDRPRHRRRRARRDPARRLPRSLSRPRRRRERPDAGPRREAAHPDRHARHASSRRSTMYAPTTLPRKEVEVGAIADPSYLAGRAAAVDIFPGQQITATDFAASDTTSVDSQITGTQRAISISIDNVHGSLSQLQAGDSVDVYTSVGGVVKLFAPNVKVLTIPAIPGPSGGSNLVLRIETGGRRRRGPTRPTTRSSTSSSARSSARSRRSRRPANAATVLR